MRSRCARIDEAPFNEDKDNGIQENERPFKPPATTVADGDMPLSTVITVRPMFSAPHVVNDRTAVAIQSLVYVKVSFTTTTSMRAYVHAA